MYFYPYHDIFFAQVAPAELEDVLRGLDGVLDVAVIGIDSEREGQVYSIVASFLVITNPLITGTKSLHSS